MTFANKFKKVFACGTAIMTIVATIPACSPITAVRGNLLEEKDISKLAPGETTKSQVLSYYGTPSARAPFSENVWMYIGKRTEEYAFFGEEIVEQKVLLVEFDKEDLVRDYALLNQEDMRNIQLTQDVTPTADSDLTVIQQLIGNIGRFQNNRNTR